MHIVKVGNEEVNLDTDLLIFDSNDVNNFLYKFASHYCYFYEKYNLANYVYKTLQDEYNNLYNKKFKEYKVNNGSSDKLAEVAAKSDEEVISLQKRYRKAELNKDAINGFLRSLDYAHESAKELCYNVRKELDKINPGIKLHNFDERSAMEKKLKQIIEGD